MILFYLSLMCFSMFIIHMLCHFCDKKREVIDIMDILDSPK